MPVEVHYSPLGRMNDVERPERFEMVFSRSDLPGGSETAVARWLERAGNLDPVYKLFLGTVYNPRSYLEQRFLNLVQALEVYYRRALYVPDPLHRQRERGALYGYRLGRYGDHEGSVTAELVCPYG